MVASREFVGAPKQDQIRPAFQVKELEGHRTVRKIRFVQGKNKKGKPTQKQETFDAKIPAGYMVFFPRGHSVRLNTEEEVRKLGFDQNADLVDMETGNVIPVTPSLDLEQEAIRHAGGASLE